MVNTKRGVFVIPALARLPHPVKGAILFLFGLVVANQFRDSVTGYPFEHSPSPMEVPTPDEMKESSESMLKEAHGGNYYRGMLIKRLHAETEEVWEVLTDAPPHTCDPYMWVTWVSSANAARMAASQKPLTRQAIETAFCENPCWRSLSWPHVRQLWLEIVLTLNKRHGYDFNPEEVPSCVEPG